MWLKESYCHAFFYFGNSNEKDASPPNSKLIYNILLTKSQAITITQFLESYIALFSFFQTWTQIMKKQTQWYIGKHTVTKIRWDPKVCVSTNPEHGCRNQEGSVGRLCQTSLTLSQPGGTDYAYHIVTYPTEFSDLTTALQKEQIREKREDS